MAIHSLMQIRYVGNQHHIPPLLKGGPEDPLMKETASQTYGIGALVYKDSNGTIAIVGDSSGRVNTHIAGQALKAATGVTGGNVYFRAIRATDLFIANVYHATAGSAVTAQTQDGTIRGLILVSGNVHVDIENSVEGASDALARVQIVGFPRTSPVDGTDNTIGDRYGFVFCQFLRLSAASDLDPEDFHLLQYDP